jgi:hypothetical protein
LAAGADFFGAGGAAFTGGFLVATALGGAAFFFAGTACLVNFAAPFAAAFLGAAGFLAADDLAAGGLAAGFFRAGTLLWAAAFFFGGAAFVADGFFFAGFALVGTALPFSCRRQGITLDDGTVELRPFLTPLGLSVHLKGLYQQTRRGRVQETSREYSIRQAVILAFLSGLV